MHPLVRLSFSERAGICCPSGGCSATAAAPSSEEVQSSCACDNLLATFFHKMRSTFQVDHFLQLYGLESNNDDQFDLRETLAPGRSRDSIPNKFDLQKPSGVLYLVIACAAAHRPASTLPILPDETKNHESMVCGGAFSHQKRSSPNVDHKRLEHVDADEGGAGAC